MSDTIKCASCSTSLHIGDEYSEDGCPVCGGSVHKTAEQEEQQRKELKDLKSGNSALNIP